VQRQQRKSDVMTNFGLTACSAVYYQVPHCRFLINLKVQSPTAHLKCYCNITVLEHRYVGLMAWHFRKYMKRRCHGKPLWNNIFMSWEKFSNIQQSTLDFSYIMRFERIRLFHPRSHTPGSVIKWTKNWVRKWGKPFFKFSAKLPAFVSERGKIKIQSPRRTLKWFL
jgi:hypothetical protein